jgi:protein-disulfide isomerase
MNRRGLTPIEVMAAIATACAVILTALVIWIKFFPPRPPVPENRAIGNWDEVVSAAHSRSSGPVQIVVYADYECPACKAFHVRSLIPVTTDFEGRVGVLHRHYPLAYHRFAKVSAVAAECAGLQGRYFDMHDLLYSYQDSLGLKPFPQIAAQASVADIDAFEQCREDQYGLDRVEYDLRSASQLELRGTPAVMIDGVLLGVTPDGAELRRLIQLRLDGKEIPVGKAR